MPGDDVWIRSFYPTPKYDLSSAIEMHRELAMPEMCDNLEGLIYFNAKLDMTTSKKVTSHEYTCFVIVHSIKKNYLISVRIYWLVVL